MTRVSLAALTLALGGLPAALAQPLSGVQVTATVSQSLEADTNYRLQETSRGTSYFADTRLDLALESETPTQRLSFGTDTGIRAFWQAEEDFEFTYADPVSARAGYTKEWAGSRLDTAFRYRRSDLDARGIAEEDLEEFLFLPVVPEDLSVFSGTEQRYDARVGLALRTDAPSSYRFGLGATRFDYLDVPAGDFDNAVPRTTFDADATWTLRFTPVLSGALLADYEFYEAEDATATEIETASLDASVIYDVSEVFNVSAGLGYSERTRTEVFFLDRVEVAHDRGPALRGSARYELPYFILQAEARVSTAAPDTRLNGAFLLRYDLKRGAIRARAYQSYSGSSSGDEVRDRGLSIGLTREINTLSRLGVDLSFVSQVSQDEIGDEEEDASRVNATASYSYDLTREISTNIGYSLRLNDQSDGGSATSNSVFFSIGRSFTGRL